VHDVPAENMRKDMPARKKKIRDSGEPPPETAEPFDQERFATQLREMWRSISAAKEARSKANY